MKNPSFSFQSRRTLPSLIQYSAALGLIVAGSTAHAVDAYKADNIVSLASNGSWQDIGGGPSTYVPANVTNSPDSWIWDSRVSVNLSASQGGTNTGIRTIKILNPGGPVTIQGGSTSAVLSISNGGGVDMSAATQDLTFTNYATGSNVGYRLGGSNVALTFNIASGRTLNMDARVAVQGGSSGAGITFNGGGTTIFTRDYQPSNAVINAGEVRFNNAAGSTRLSTNTTTVNGGKMVVNNASGSATGSGAVNINSTGTVTGQGIMTGLVTVNSGGTLSPGNGLGTLKAGSLTLAASSVVRWEGDPSLVATPDLIDVTGTNSLTINGGTLQLVNVGTNDAFTGTGTFNIFAYNGGAIPAYGNLTIPESFKISGQTYLFGVSIGTPNYVTLQIGPDTRPKAFWNVDADGTWSTGTNWTGGVAPNASTFVANLGGTLGTPITAPRTVTLNSDSIVGTLNFDSAQPFTLAGTNTLTFNIGVGPGTLHVENGSHLISAPITIPNEGLLTSIKNAGSTLVIQSVIQSVEFADPLTSGLSKTNPGTLILSADNIYPGNTSNASGLLQIGAGGTTGSVVGTITNNGTLRFDRSNVLDLNFGNEISGTGGVEFAGSGTTNLWTANTYSGPTTISPVSSIQIGSNLALQNSTLTYSTTGGTLTIADFLGSVTLGGLSGDRPFPLTDIGLNPVSLTVGQNNASTSYTASTIGTGTNFTKAGSGTFSLSGTHVFSGAATINSGVLSLNAAADFTSSAVNFATGTSVGTSKLIINGGALHVSGPSLVTNASLGIEIAAGSANFAGGLISDNNSDFGAFNVRATGGTLDIASVSYGRGNLNFGPNPNPVEPTAGSTGAGLYINGGTVNISGELSIGKSASNSSVSARVDSGSLTVGGATTVAINSPDRWSALDIFGGTFTSTDVTTGVRLGGTTAGQVVMLVRGGVVKAERFQFGQPNLTGSAILNQTGGSLYVGAGGMVIGSTGITARLKLGGGVLGATADSSSTVRVSLTGPAVVTGADALDVPHTVTFSGTVDGTGSLTKNGSGSVSFTSPNTSFTGAVTVNSGTLGLGGQTGAVTVSPTGALTPRGTLNTQAASTVNGTLAIRYDVDNLFQPGRIHSQGTLTLGAGSVLNISGTGTLTDPVYFLASGASGISGTFGSISGVPSGYTLDTNFNNGSGFPVIALVSNTASPFDLWASGFGLSGAAAGANADPDNDGVRNLVEFGLGSNPTQSSSGPVLGQSGNFLTLTFNHIAGGGITFVIEASDTLTGTWNTVQTYPTFGSAGTTIYTDNVAVGSTTRRFLRLGVILSN